MHPRSKTVRCLQNMYLKTDRHAQNLQHHQTVVHSSGVATRPVLTMPPSETATKSQLLTGTNGKRGKIWAPRISRTNITANTLRCRCCRRRRVSSRGNNATDRATRRPLADATRAVNTARCAGALALRRVLARRGELADAYALVRGGEPAALGRVRVGARRRFDVLGAREPRALRAVARASWCAAPPACSALLTCASPPAAAPSSASDMPPVRVACSPCRTRHEADAPIQRHSKRPPRPHGRRPTAHTTSSTRPARSRIHTPRRRTSRYTRPAS
jgi:hypothetical protein